MDSKEASKAIAIFRNKLPGPLATSGIVSITVNADDGAIEVGISDFDESTDYFSLFGLESYFRLTEDDSERIFEVRFVPGETIFPHAIPIRCGTPSFGQGLGGYGTAGWFFLDKNENLQVVSNWHVFCPNGNQTELGLPVTVDGEPSVARLHSFIPMAANNKFDLAVATVVADHRASFSNTNRLCQDQSQLPFPTRLAENVDLDTSVIYQKVGARSPYCRDGRISHFGSVSVNYSVGSYWFDDQIIFDKFTDPGDSGSLIVRQHDNAIIGLNFAGSTNWTIANPFHEIGWPYLGTSTIGGLEFPVYDLNNEEERALPPGLGVGAHLTKSSFTDSRVQKSDFRVIRTIGSWVLIEFNAFGPEPPDRRWTENQWVYWPSVSQDWKFQ